MLNKEEIKNIIPQREPFLMIDEVEEFIPGESAIAYKNVNEQEWYFKGHFPGNPIMPGVLITESLAQTGAVAILSMNENKGKNALFGGIDKMKFKRKVVPGDRLKLEVSKSIREDYLQQNGFHEIDTYTSLDKQYKMLKLVLLFRKEAERALEAGVYLDKILGLEVRDKIARSKYIHEDDIAKMDDIAAELRADIDTLINEGGVLNA